MGEASREAMREMRETAGMGRGNSTKRRDDDMDRDDDEVQAGVPKFKGHHHRNKKSRR